LRARQSMGLRSERNLKIHVFEFSPGGAG
jgi:hypothetical protein